MSEVYKHNYAKSNIDLIEDIQSWMKLRWPWRWRRSERASEHNWYFQCRKFYPSANGHSSQYCHIVWMFIFRSSSVCYCWSRMLDASGIYAHKYTSVNNVRNCVCAFDASLLFPLLQTLFACIIKPCNKIVVAIVSIFCPIPLYTCCADDGDDVWVMSLCFICTHSTHTHSVFYI